MGLFDSPLGIVGFVVLLLLGLALFFAIIFGAAFALLGRMARRKEASARARYPQARHIDRAASFFGQESRGAAQLRGNGTLILTDEELIFELWVPERAFHIPLHRIQSLESPSSFLGKSRGAPLLKVAYTNEQGAADAIAWQVPDLSGWMRRIDEARA